MAGAEAKNDPAMWVLAGAVLVAGGIVYAVSSNDSAIGCR